MLDEDEDEDPGLKTTSSGAPFLDNIKLTASTSIIGGNGTRLLLHVAWWPSK